MAQELMVDVHGPSLPPVAEKLERLLGGANESRTGNFPEAACLANFSRPPPPLHRDLVSPARKPARCHRVFA